jgi:hypothetical protein
MVTNPDTGNSDCETAEGCWLLVFVLMEGRGQKNTRCTDPYNVGCCGGKQRARGAIGKDKLSELVIRNRGIIGSG